MRGILRGRVGLSALAVLSMAGLLAPLARSAAGSDDGLFEARPHSYVQYSNADSAPLFRLRANALYLHRSAPQSNVVVTEFGTGNALLNSAQNDPDWAGGTEVNFQLDFDDATTFEWDWFSVDDWFDRQSVSPGGGPIGTFVNEVIFPITTASTTVSSRIRNMEFNLREKVSDRITLIGGVRFVEYLDSLGVHYGNETFGFSEDVVINTANRLYGVQIGAQGTLWEGDCWQLDSWLKVGGYGNSAANNSGITSAGIPPQARTIRADDGHGAFVLDFGVRGSRQFNKYISAFVGYRLMFLDGLALAANQYPGVVGTIAGAPQSITMGNSVLFQGIEAGLTFTF